MNDGRDETKVQGVMANRDEPTVRMNWDGNMPA